MDRANQLIAVMGLPGSGKTTLSQALAIHYGGEVFSPGDTLRRLAADGDAAAAELLRTGAGLQPEVYRDIVAKHISGCVKHPVILDGGARTPGQVHALGELYASEVVGLVLLVSPTTALQRLTIRSAGSARLDDDLRLIASRLRTQETLLLSTRAAFGQRYSLHEIDAERRPAAVAATAVSILDSLVTLTEGAPQPLRAQ